MVIYCNKQKASMQAKHFCTSTIAESWAKFGTSKMHLSPRWLRLLSVLWRWFYCCFFVDCCSRCWSLNCCSFCFKLLYVHSSFAIILRGKRELVDVLGVGSWFS